MRVTQVTPTVFGDGGLFGGGERYPVELARALAREVPCRLVAYGHTAVERVDHESGLEVTVLPARRYARGHPAHPVGAGLLRALRGADIVHCHQLHSRTTGVALHGARARRQHRVVTDHGLRDRTRRNPAALVERFLTVSQYSAGLLDSLADRTAVVFGGADPARFHPDRDDGRGGVLFLGRITPHKGVDRLIAALPAGAELTIAGSVGHDPKPPERDYPELLRALATSTAGRVTFTGPLTDQDLPRLLRRHAVLALPSVQETCYGRRVAISELLGLTVIEAMASGTPVVCSRIGGVPEVVTDGDNGFLVPPGDVEALHERLAALLCDPVRRERMGRCGRETVCERFTWTACAHRCLDGYAALVRDANQPTREA
jgi:glycosyltransferase involved in cell wall biosynthesis